MDKFGSSSSKTTSTLNESIVEESELDGLPSFDGLCLDEGTKKKRHRPRKRTHQRKSSKVNEDRDLDEVVNKEKVALKQDKDEDLIDEVFRELVNSHPMPKIKFNFSKMLTPTKKQIPDAEESDIIAVEALSFLANSDLVSTEVNEQKEKKKKKKKHKEKISVAEIEQFIQNSLPSSVVKNLSMLSSPSTSNNNKITTRSPNTSKENKTTSSPSTSNKKIDTLSSPSAPDKNKSTPSPSKRKSKSEKKAKAAESFEPYLTEDEVSLGLSSGSMLAGPIRINQRNFRESYISSSKDKDKDILIEGVLNRNRALEGDEVVVLIDSEDKWKSGAYSQKTGKVVRILEYIHPRTCVGQLGVKAGIEKLEFHVFSPRDSRIPRLRIPTRSLPEDVLKNPKKYQNMIWYAKIDEWSEVGFGNGTLLKMIGTSGDLEGETLSLMLENGLDHEPIPVELAEYYPKIPFVIPDEELRRRTDLRKECIFTIDPATARDLDDAVSCKVLPNGNFEVGVHISDVTYFLKRDTPLDEAVSKRATTVYLIQRVYHMLPVDLCLLCSLTPGEDKLAFSVIFEINSDAEVINQRFCRSVIRSCSKFAYEHAQLIIDNPDKEWSRDDFPEIGNGFSPDDCASTVKHLFKLSVIMRERRFSTGALRLDLPKLYFSLDPETYRPTSCFIYEIKESHRLIEEFMLLANMAVARHIYNTYPELAFLRNHCPPRTRLMTELQEKLSKLGINLDISSAGSIHSSLRKYLPVTSTDLFEWLRSAVLYNLCSRPMKRALYFTPDQEMEEEEFHHYALNCPLYTHFTSPIRRYADVMVHRLLAAAIESDTEPSWSLEYSQKIANMCNLKKYNAKLAGDQSSILFLALYLEEHGPIVTQAGVFDVKDHSFDCILYNFAVPLRIYTNQCDAKTSFNADNGLSTLELQWDENTKQTIQILSVVNIQISKSKDLVKLDGILLPPS